MTFGKNSSARRALIGTCTGMMAVLAGCAHVKPDELATQLDQLRGEMRSEYQQGDQKVASDLGGRIDGIDARLGQLAADLGELSRNFDVTVERMENAIRFQAPVFFTFDEATLRDEDRPVLDRFAGVIKDSYPGVVITAEGFTDPSGSVEYNQALGKRRADAVVSYLTTTGGLDVAQVRAVSYGEDTKRLLDGDRGPGNAGIRNRRVVLVIESPPPPADALITYNTDTDR